MAVSPKFISFEGIDGCGKTTLLERLSLWLDQCGVAHIRTREPGGTMVGEKIRDILLDPSHGALDRRTEVLLHTASRAQHAREIIAPALRKGIWVLTDRYTDATLAYQGYGRGLELDRLRTIQDWATGGLWPHRTILLDCDVETASSRLKGRSKEADRMEREALAFHQRVREGYLKLAEAEPHRFVVLDAARELPEVLEAFRSILGELLPAQEKNERA